MSETLLHGTDRWRRGSDGVGGRGVASDLGTRMPFKANADRRHHIPRQKRKVTDAAAYDASLRQRGSLTV